MQQSTCSNGCDAPTHCKGLCKPCYGRDYYQRNHERAREYRRSWYEQNADAVKAKVRAAYAADPESKKAQIKAWKDRNPDYQRAYDARRYAENRGERLAAAKAYYQENRAALIARASEWAAANPEKRRGIRRRYKKTSRGRLVDLANVHARLARKRGAPGKATPEQLNARWAHFGGRCWMCFAEATQWDHVIALAAGGTNWPSNLRPACGPCNQSKGKRPYRRKNHG